MEHCSKSQAGTDFTILICAELVIYISGMSVSGFIASHIGYSLLFTLGSALSIPGFIIALLVLNKIKRTKTNIEPENLTIKV